MTTRRWASPAKGAWESASAIFRELGINTQAEPFSVVGIGDMGGDVFGNGMLLFAAHTIEGQLSITCISFWIRTRILEKSFCRT